MTSMLDIIMAASGLSDYGICSFDAVADCLLPCLAKGRLPEEAKSIICVLFPYKVPMEKGNLSSYATVPDYHEIAGRMLTGVANALSKAFPPFEFVWFVDNSPIPEVYAASLCGLGCIGDNHLLINKRYGSYCFIGTIVTSLEMPLTGSGKISECQHCGRCVKSCPGGALCSDGSFCREKCLSAISQRKGALTPEEINLLRKGGLVWGCDTCQDVCPMNVDAEYTYIAPFLQYANPNASISGLATAKDRAYLYRGKAVVERNIRALEEE